MARCVNVIRFKVLDMQSVVKSQITRSRSVPPRRSLQKEVESRRRIDLGNERLMQSLINISARRRCETPVSVRRRKTPTGSKKGSNG
ncbi:hypothetical protein GCK32_006026 [Trichostrongylus colubriformis]|uniref:Uncharacterized protein n=1 Tax=Trichostrongylus colubriformis TaxID=6319 RepID=A0AAN8IXU8_TRICO